ncbi:MAG TPA: TraR/DksA C4-type zinc finger protein [Burkholderiales bacterium]|nr:TraR/DksA C4-type zinc finger protein [Burkholderiales bacterium]
MPLTASQKERLARAIEARHRALEYEIRGDPPGEPETTRDVRELRALEAAQRRLAEGSYGICVDCGSDVGYERLAAEPDAARCIECQRRHEKTYRE